MKPLVVVPNYVTNMEDLSVLETCLSSLRFTAKDACDVLVVDDGSPAQDVVEGCRGLAEHFGCEFVAKEENTGFAATVNVGLRRALNEGRDAVLCNADIEFIRGASTWLDLMVRQCGVDGVTPAAMVGALLLYPNNTIQHCSPGTERVLTHHDGYVPLAELDESTHGLRTYDRRINMVLRGDRKGKAPKHVNSGYDATVTKQPYSGAILEVESAHGRAEVTPNHKLSVMWREEVFGKWVVYLMRRGRNWRIGRCRAFQANGTFGPGMRLRCQEGEDLWVLDWCGSEAEVWKQENILAWTYGIPTWEFKAIGREGGRTDQSRLDDLWKSIDCTERVDALLVDKGLDEQSPLLSRSNGRAFPMSRQARPTVSAVNLDPRVMLVPTSDGESLKPAWESFGVTRGTFDGYVFGLDVPPHEHYINEGMIVHNSGIYFSVLYREFDHVFRYGPHNLPEARHARVLPVTGALQFIRSSTLEKVGIYDETFKLGWEDVDYNVRTWLAGLEIIYQPAVRAYHHEGFFRGSGRNDPTSKVAQWQSMSWHRFKEKWGDTNFAEFIPSLL